MADIAKMIDKRRGNTPYDDLAREIGMKTPTLYRYLNNERTMGLDNVRKIAAWAKSKGDYELVNALVSYALGFEVESSG